MAIQRILLVIKLFLLLFTVQVQGEPTFNYIRYLGSQATRPLLVEERFVIEFSYTRLPEDADNYPDNNLYAETFGENQLEYCRFYECNPPEYYQWYIADFIAYRRGCYCKNVTGNDYFFVINTTARFLDDHHSGAPLKVHWRPQQTWPDDSLQPVYSDMITLPVVCPEPRATVTLLSLDLEQLPEQVAGLDFGGSSHTFVLFPGVQYSFRVDLADFLRPYTVTLRTNDTERIRLTNGTTLTSPVTDDDIGTGRIFTVTVNEATGCRYSRPRSYRVKFERIPARFASSWLPMLSDLRRIRNGLL